GADDGLRAVPGMGASGSADSRGERFREFHRKLQVKTIGIITLCDLSSQGVNCSADVWRIPNGIVNLPDAHPVCHSCGMDILPATTKYKNHRFPAEIISHAVQGLHMDGEGRCRARARP